ncbi:tyrosyl-tRNA synthetase [Trametopsis cervina]|nr:tyrosyl-tRNA synthetase [Trametopsis cervina]
MLRLQRAIPRNLRSTRSQSSTSSRLLHVKSGLLDELHARGLISQVSSADKLRDALKSSQGVYSGIDPTAQYLHVGHLLPLLSLLHFQLAGHRVIPLIGGATGLVGDPSGRDTERPLSDSTVVESNVHHLASAITKFFHRGLAYASSRASEPSESNASDLQPPPVMNNLQWFQGIGLLEFLRTVGLHARVNTMIARESVQTRLASQQGISFTEFTYQLLQAYDFYHLNKNEGCTIQIGGSDQWGNIVAGIDLINKLDVGRASGEAGKDGDGAREVFAVTTPLLTTPSGQKFGKSAGNAVALDEKITSVFDFYQFWLRTPDSHVGQYLKMFTLVPLQDIDILLSAHNSNPESRFAQQLLAKEVTELVHGGSAAHKARIASRVLYESDYSSVKTEDILSSLSGDPRLKLLSEEELLGTPVAKLAVQAKLIASNSEAKRLVEAKGLYVNNERVPNFLDTVSKEDLLDGRFVVVRCGSQKQLVLVAS